MPPVASPATSNWKRSAIRRPGARRAGVRGGPAANAGLLAQLGQDLDDLLLAVHDLREEADAIDVALVVPGGLHQDAGLLLRRDGQAAHRLREELAVELADLLGRVLDRVDAGVALEAVVVRQVLVALEESLAERQDRRDR